MEAGGLLPHQPSQGPPGGAGGQNLCLGQQQQRRVTNQSPVHSALEQLNSGQLGLTSQQQLQHLQQQMGQAPNMGEIITPKKQVAVDRLRRRMDEYRRHQTHVTPRFEQSFNGLCEQESQGTLLLKQRFFDNKAKRQAKKADKKQNETVGLSSVHVVSSQIFLKDCFVILIWYFSLLRLCRVIVTSLTT